MNRTVFAIALFLLLVNGSYLQAQYPFIRHDLNRLELPADSSQWVSLAKHLREAQTGGRLSILHFGDSHIQGDYFTGQVRRHLNNFLEVENGSRGITMPYRALGTNGPDELYAKKEGEFEITSVRKNMPDIYALSGYCLAATSANCIVNIEDTSYHFNRAAIFHSPLNIATLSLNGSLAVSTSALTDSLYVSEFRMPGLHQRLNLRISNASLVNKIRIYGFSLENDKSNATYSNIGVNGATFGTFLNLYGTKEILKYLKPDCVVFSYGTNDALYKLDTALMKTQMVACINKVKTALDVPVIFTTPGDHLINNKKNVNPRTAFASRLIKTTALENGCAAWDFFSIMGGKGSVRDWYSSQMFFKDGIHLSKKGYRYQGDLFFEAFIKLKDLEKAD